MCTFPLCDIINQPDPAKKEFAISWAMMEMT